MNTSSDIRHDQIVWTPSFGLVVASTRNKQTLLQSDPDDLYSAETRLRWNDVGVKTGLAFSVPLAPTVEWSLEGTLAVLYRRANFSGSDFLDVSGTDIGSSISLNANTWTFVPALQTQIVMRPAPNIQVSAFGGVEWDTRTPQIIAPSFADFPLGPGQPASLGFSTQTSYRIGGSFTYAFNP